MTPPVTTAAFERSHGRRPRGTGSWAFSASQTSRAFTDDLRGNVAFFQGTFTEARRQAVAHFHAGPFVAVLP